MSSNENRKKTEKISHQRKNLKTQAQVKMKDTHLRDTYIEVKDQQNENLKERNKTLIKLFDRRAFCILKMKENK